jgi:hypothetical protein
MRAEEPASPDENHRETRLDSALDDYLLAKSKANKTGNYRRDTECVLAVSKQTSQLTGFVRY